MELTKNLDKTDTKQKTRYSQVFQNKYTEEIVKFQYKTIEQDRVPRDWQQLMYWIEVNCECEYPRILQELEQETIQYQQFQETKLKCSQCGFKESFFKYTG